MFYVRTNDWSANINMTVSNLGIFGEAIVSMSGDKFMDELMKYLSGVLSKAYTEMGAQDFRLERVKLKFLGTEGEGFSITSKVAGTVTMYQKMAICIRGEYGYNITATSIGYDITDNLLSMFRRISE
ncbi:MAG: hypothetical protein IJS28_09795 [Synergistaceae bacterium]|nr:hypothetical protein [Synergistaceae bacterium]